MKLMVKSKIAVLIGVVVIAPTLTEASNLIAATPNAGTILDTVRDKDFVEPKKAAPVIDFQQEAPPAMKPVAGFKTRVSSFHITGATVYTEAQLQALIVSSVGLELSFADLEKICADISHYYRDQGYFVARAYVPAQEIRNGVVEIAVLEGRIGNVNLKLKGEGRISEAPLERIFSGSAKKGDVVNEQQLERGMLLANDLAGVSISSTLIPGASVGTSDLVVEAMQTGILSGGVDVDNSGSKFTGVSRLGASLNMNNPARQGDQISLRLMTSGNGLNYGRAAYVLPVGDAGTKIGAAYSSMHYTLSGDFSAVGAHGEAQIASVYAIQPMIRSRNYNLYAQIGFDGKRMLDQTSTTMPHKVNDLWMIAFSGDSRDALGGGGLNNYNFTFYSGKLDLSGDAATQSTDAGTTRSAGSYAKIALEKMPADQRAQAQIYRFKENVKPVT